MDNNDPILVIGHRNPDTDAIASAVGYAWLLDNTHDEHYIAGRAGHVNAQTTFALQRFGIEAPALVGDVRSRVSDIAEVLPTLRDGQTLLEACQLIARTRRPAPLLSADDKPIGMLTGEDLFASFAAALSSTSVLALAEEFNRPARTAIDSPGTILSDDEFVQDVISPVLRTEYDEFLVVNAQGQYSGVVRKSRLLSPPRRRVVLVDHNELGQSVAGLEEAEVVEVLDHHRIGSMVTSVPIRMQIEPVGSCSTLVSERALEAGKRFPAPIAGLLLCGILSDTLIFRSPTATDRDRRAAFALANMSALTAKDASEAQMLDAISELGSALLDAGAGLGIRPAAEIVSTDVKYYEENGAKLGIAQVEVTSFSEVSARLPDLRAALTEMTDAGKLEMALLMITDVVRGNSRLLAVGQPRTIAALPYPRLNDGTLDAPGLVSRKKQLLPTVLNALSNAI